MTVDPKERARIEAEIRHKAQRRVRNKVGLMWHAMVFAMANGAMIAINMNYSPNTLWYVWPLGGWGAALLMHAFAVFQGTSISSDMVEAEVQRELQRRGLA
jgi:2TM domain